MSDSRSSVPLFLVLLAATIILLIASIRYHDEQNTPTPVATATVTASPSPSFTKSDDGYEIAYTIISGVWQQKPRVDQQLLCKGWKILPHDTVLDKLETALKGSNEEVGISDGQYREAATDFLNGECNDN